MQKLITHRLDKEELFTFTPEQLQKRLNND